MVGTSITLHASNDFVSISEQRISDFATENGFKEGKRKIPCKELLYTKPVPIGGMTLFSVSFRKYPDAVAIQVNAASTPPLYMLVDPCPGLYSFINIIDDNGKEKHVNLETYVLSLILSEYREYADNKQPEDYMQLSLSYSELASIVSRHLGEDIKFEYGGNPSRVKTTYHHIPFYLNIQPVNGNIVTVSHQIGRDAEAVPPGVLGDPCPRDFFLTGMLRTGCQNAVRRFVNSYLGKKLTAPFVKINAEGAVSIDLSQVDALSGIINTIQLKSVEFNEKQAIVSFNVLQEV